MNIKTKIKERKSLSAKEAITLTKVYQSIETNSYYIKLPFTDPTMEHFLIIGYGYSNINTFIPVTRPTILTFTKDAVFREFGDFNCEVVEL